MWVCVFFYNFIGHGQLKIKWCVLNWSRLTIFKSIKNNISVLFRKGCVCFWKRLFAIQIKANESLTLALSLLLQIKIISLIHEHCHRFWLKQHQNKCHKPSRYFVLKLIAINIANWILHRFGRIFYRTKILIGIFFMNVDEL